MLTDYYRSLGWMTARLSRFDNNIEFEFRLPEILTGSKLRLFNEDQFVIVFLFLFLHNPVFYLVLKKRQNY